MNSTAKQRVLKTIGSEKVHHVKLASERIRSAFSDEDWTNFSALHTERERVEWLWLQKSDVVNLELSSCLEKLKSLLAEEKESILRDLNCNSSESESWKFQKDEPVGLAFKERGNQAFKLGNNVEALEFYTEALLWIPKNSQEMPILHANRSAALFHLEEPTLALVDIELALSNNYPPNLVYKLQERAGRIYFKQGNATEAKKSFGEAITSLTNLMSSGADPKLAELKTKIETMLTNCKNLKSTATKSSKAGVQVQALPKITSGGGQCFQNASRKLKLAETSSRGRFMLATGPIFPGEVLLVEKAFVSAITSEYVHRQCAQCFTQIRAPIPCAACSLISYCSPGCREASWKSHHRYECGIWGLLTQAGLSITSVMALRLLTNAGSSQDVISWLQKPEFLATSPPQTPNNTEQIYPANTIDSFLRLVSHAEKRNPDDWFQRSIMALFLLSLLKLTPFCTSCEQDAGKSLQEEIKLATILVRLLQILQFNAHEVAGWDPVEPKSYFLGGAVFPTLALFNHSCSPAIVRYFINDTVIVQAIRTILPGEEVTENYGPLYTSLEREKRQAHLRAQYWFDCQCVACTEDWPLLANMTSDTLKLRCSSCHTPLNSPSENDESLLLVLQCQACSKPTNFMKTLKLVEASEEKFNGATEQLQGGKLDEAKQIFGQLLKFFDSALVLPFRDYHLCQEGMRKCILPLGNQTVRFW